MPLNFENQAEARNFLSWNLLLLRKFQLALADMGSEDDALLSWNFWHQKIFFKLQYLALLANANAGGGGMMVPSYSGECFDPSVCDGDDNIKFVDFKSGDAATANSAQIMIISRQKNVSSAWLMFCPHPSGWYGW